jgi:hypothetical protein
MEILELRRNQALTGEVTTRFVDLTAAASGGAAAHRRTES